ncbi:hypothetical protein I551_0671 [Mycobacterium ulcerans str. Harvey]|uniref:Uncharacterized protein n=1 Tax=Mycobacterium ulcerans str. Harvey TaxID=1299332 RepID=A0ABN0R6X8_MYCUL|nr:hypothetical protein I551_0671 [Mycobacterium ulcerans str. Harvey]
MSPRWNLPASTAAARADSDDGSRNPRRRGYLPPGCRRWRCRS